MASQGCGICLLDCGGEDVLALVVVCLSGWLAGWWEVTVRLESRVEMSLGANGVLS